MLSTHVLINEKWTDICAGTFAGVSVSMGVDEEKKKLTHNHTSTLKI